MAESPLGQPTFIRRSYLSAISVIAIDCQMSFLGVSVQISWMTNVASAANGIWPQKSGSQKNKTSKKYPKNTDIGATTPPIGRSVNEKYIIPIEQNFDWLTSAVTHAAYHVTNGLWNKGVMDDYLCICVISKRVWSHLWSVLKAGEGKSLMTQTEKSTPDTRESPAKIEILSQWFGKVALK